MPKEPQPDTTEAPDAPVVAPEPEPAAPAEAPAPVLAAWEAEVEVFWQNVLLNVSAHVETPIHNFLHAEKEALKVRLKALF